MKLKYLPIAIVVFFTFLVLTTQAQPPKVEVEVKHSLENYEDTTHYCLGILMGSRFFPKSYYPELNLDQLIKGIKDERNKKALFTPQECNKIVMPFNKILQENPNHSFRSGYVDTISYSFGVLISNRYISTEFYPNLNEIALKRGVSDSRNNKNTITNELAMSIVNLYNQRLLRTKYQNNIKEEENFLKANAKKPSVITTQSGLQYEVIEEGTGSVFPQPTDKVKVNYKGSLVDKSVFDENNGIEFQLNGVIPGWTEGLGLMTKGSKFRFFIPAKLAYGERGNRGIEPFKLLIFEVELIEIK